MNRLQKVIIAVGVAGAVGLTYVITALKSMPEAFDWENEEEDDE